MTVELSQAVAQSADAAGLHAPVPALLLELQSLVGTLFVTVPPTPTVDASPFVPARTGNRAWAISSTGRVAANSRRPASAGPAAAEIQDDFLRRSG
jgi:hypothetical protein